SSLKYSAASSARGFSAEEPAAVMVPLSSSAAASPDAADAEAEDSEVDPSEDPEVLVASEFPPHPASTPVATIAVITNAIIFLFIVFSPCFSSFFGLKNFTFRFYKSILTILCKIQNQQMVKSMLIPVFFAQIMLSVCKIWGFE